MIKKRERERERESERMKERERERVCACMLCVREREREREPNVPKGQRLSSVRWRCAGIFKPDVIKRWHCKARIHM